MEVGPPETGLPEKNSESFSSATRRLLAEPLLFVMNLAPRGASRTVDRIMAAVYEDVILGLWNFSELKRWECLGEWKCELWKYQYPLCNQ